MGELLVLNDREGQWQRLKGLALNSVTSPHSKRAYEAGLDHFRAWHETTGEAAPLFSKAAVNAYRAALEARGLAPSTINVRLSAIRRLVAEATDNGLIAPELAAGVARVKSVPRLGRRIGNWLSKSQTEALLEAPDAGTITGARDRALLGVLIGCGLRRDEAARLEVEQLQQREGRWMIVDLVGKHGRVRSIPMAPWTRALIDQWTEAAGITSGRVFRPLNRGGRLTGEKFANARACWVCVQKYSGAIGVGALAPHDLRRTFAKLAHKGRAALEQIQLSLGHSSIQTTERYLGVQQDLQDAPCDHLDLRITARAPAAAAA